ncbi:MAG TPA: 3-hydroxyacyl-CoA dehydrogenase family protein [Bacteroidota bacterium]|nr:3-hydroxyacyl-CoA dehydrogenase family protein [Bacteroidota bacterium]
MARSRALPARGGVFITGDSPLVMEYASECERARIATTVRVNSGSPAKTLSTRGRAQRVPSSCSIAVELTNTSLDTKQKNLRELSRRLAPGRPILTSASTVCVAEQSQWLTPPRQLIGIAALPGLLQGRLVELSPGEGTGSAVLAEAQEFCRKLGKEWALVQDSPGMVMPRILCMLVNEAYFALGERTAEPSDIDTAMRLGTNYPRGPMEWGERIGLTQVCAVLDGLWRYFGEDRYRTAPLLRRLAGASARER